MIINIEDKSGFCYGVERVIRMAEELLLKGEEVWCLGQIVHNESEVERLMNLGMKFISHDELKNLQNKKLLIRAHGEPPSTYLTAYQNNLEIIEGTCPIVQKLQKKIHTLFEQESLNELSIVIFGKEAHPEVIGLKGQTENKALVIKSVEEAAAIPLKENVVLFSQTTMDSVEFDQIAAVLEGRVFAGKGTFIKKKSICGHVSHRKPGLIRFAGENDVIVFVGGKNSSNAKVLFNICKSVNERSYFISSEKEISPSWFNNVSSVGICGATSTPAWQINEVAARIGEVNKD